MDRYVRQVAPRSQTQDAAVDDKKDAAGCHESNQSMPVDPGVAVVGVAPFVFVTE